jgi:hypothetical protein
LTTKENFSKLYIRSSDRDRKKGKIMKVTNIQSVTKPDYKEEYLTMSTGHVATLVQFNDGTEEMHLHSKTGKRVQVGNTSWQAAERAIWNTNPTRSKF